MKYYMIILADEEYVIKNEIIEKLSQEKWQPVLLNIVAITYKIKMNTW